jgi:uncharacterized membrane protein YbhN (UPF0104 family)
VVAFGVLAVYLVRHRAYIEAHYAARPDALLLIAAAILASLVARSLSHVALFRPLGVAASAWDWFRVVTMSSFANYLPLSAGTVAKAYVLKRVHALSYDTFVVAQVALLVIVVSTNGAVGLASLALAAPAHLFGFVGAGFALMLATTALLMFPASALRFRRGATAWWDADAIPALRRGWPVAALWQVGNLLATAAALQVAFSLGANPVGFAACLVFSAASMLTRFVAITPGAIGIREFLVGGLAHWTGFELRDAVIAAAVTRTVEIVVVFALGGAFTYRLSHEVAASYSKTEESGEAAESDDR